MMCSGRVPRLRPRALLRRDGLMEPLLVLGAFIALAVLALRFGHDSRTGAIPAEETLGRRGIRWDIQGDNNPATSVNFLPAARARDLARFCCIAIAQALRS